jgi:hypothetical protein
VKKYKGRKVISVNRKEVWQADFEMGHGHANAIVAVFRKENGL